MTSADIRKMVDIFPLPVFLTQDGFIRLVNPGMKELAGYSLESLLEIPLTMLLYPEEKVRAVVDSLSRPDRDIQSYDCGLMLKTRLGKAINVQIRFAPVEFNGQPAALGMVTEIWDGAGAEKGRPVVYYKPGSVMRVNYLKSLIENIMEEALKINESRYRAIVETQTEMICRILPDGTLTFVNDAYCRYFNKKREDLLGVSFMPMVPEEDQDIVDNHLRSLNRNNPVATIEHRVISPGGEIRWQGWTDCAIFDDNGEIVEFQSVGRDITDRRLAEEALRESEANYRAIFDAANDAIFIHEIKTGRIVDANRKMFEMFGYTPEEAKLLDIDIIGMGESPFSREEVNRYLGEAARGEPQIFDWMARDKSGRIFWVEINLRKAVIGGLDSLLAVVRDITARKEAEERLKFLSLHDSLTGLYNRAYFEEELSRLGKGRQHRLGIVVCDLDGLKLINDTLGHNTGDSFLVAAADIIKQSFREADVVARIGGDEFAVLLSDCDRNAAEAACQRIQHNLDGYNREHPDLPLSISVGCAVGDLRSSDLASIFKEADNNMYREKLHRSQSARSSVVQILMKALEARDFITEGHGERLQDMVSELALSIGIPVRNTNDLRLLAQFHDIGKVGIPDSILFKPGPLTPGEVAEMRRHCEIGYRIAQSAPDLVPVADWILKHHEWWNGQGYPLGLEGEQIPLECRILAIADAYDAMTSNRPYRRAMPVDEALAELKRGSGTQFDPFLVHVFINVIKKNLDVQ